MKYLFWISIIFFSCSNKKENNCSYPNWKTFSIYKNAASIDLPEQLLKLQDTVRNNFEGYDSMLLSICTLFTHDSLSSVFIKVRDNPLPNKNFVEYANELQSYYKSLLKYDNNSYSTQEIDTLGNKRLFKFIFLSKRDSSNIAFGGLLYYINNIRFEILININEHNFDNIRNRLECILNSLKINQ